MSKKYFIQTFGCQMNEHDSEVMAGLLEEKGFEPAASKNDADLVLFNTCSVRDNADKRFFGTLGQLKNKKLEMGDDLIVCCTGCMMQQQRVIDSIKTKYPWVDVVIGTHNIHELPVLLDNLYTERQKQLSVWQDGGEIIEGLPVKRLFRHKSYVNITFGCNNFCTYCIVPYTRGRERSRKPEDIVKEVEDLVADGVKEIMLLGQNVNSYKGDPEGSVTDFPDLVKRLNDVEGLERIRFMTSHPKDLSDKLIDCFRTCDKLCHNFHLPVQSGSDRILKRMNRRY
ncbi:MAG: MiaB/RimO family radical SAM methylthiotransferase, partial [Firmicutes bacterium]|nr:MiaB/RimO family radical SAM methylthiotransferase [Bacillota bacterium]